MPSPILTTLNKQGLAIGLWDACHVVNSIRWDQLRLEQFNLSKRNRELVTTLLRRADWLEQKFEGSNASTAYAENELKALKWAIASLLFVAGEKLEISSSQGQEVTK